MSRRPNGTDNTTLLAYFVVVCLGGLSPVLVRITLRELPPLWGGFLRFGFGLGEVQRALVAASRDEEHDGDQRDGGAHGQELDRSK